MIGQELERPDAAPSGQGSGLRILFLTPRFPYPPIKGDTLRVYHQIRALSRDHKITLLSIADAPVSAADMAQVQALCERVEVVPLPSWRAMLSMATGLFKPEPLQVSYYQIPAVRERLRELLREQFDVLHVTLIRMLPYVRDLKNPPVVVDLIDSLGLNLEARRNAVAFPKSIVYGLEYSRVKAFEQAAARRFPALVVSSPADRDALHSSNVEVIPNGVDVDKFAFKVQAQRDPETLIFTGNMGYEPNEVAVVWFAAEVWPLLRAKRPNLRWQIVGARPTEQVRSLHKPEAGIEVLGQVPDMIEYLGRATVAVAPMRNGSGIQNKVLEALAVGAPVVATSIANRGVQAQNGRDLLVADSAADFAAAVERLLAAPQTRAELSQAGRLFVEQNFRWEAHARRLTELYAAVQQKV